MRERQSHTQRRPGFRCAQSGYVCYRMIFYPAPDDVQVLMLAVIDKGERENLSKAERNKLRKELAGYVDDYRTSVKAKVAHEDCRATPTVRSEPI